MSMIAAVFAATAALSAPVVPSASVHAVVDPPDCVLPQIPETVIKDGQPVVRCVTPPGAGSPGKQLGDFIRGNRFQRGKRSYAFCMGNRYLAKKVRGRYRVTKAKRVKRKSGRVTITATIVLTPNKGKKSTLKSVLTTAGLRINGVLFGFGGPAPPC